MSTTTKSEPPRTTKAPRRPVVEPEPDIPPLSETIDEDARARPLSVDDF